MSRVLFVSAIAGIAAGANVEALPPQTRVTVCVDSSNPGTGVVFRAQMLAARMYAPIGIRLEWASRSRACPPDGILIYVRDETPESFHPDSLAFAMPFEGHRIEIFYDRIQQFVEPQLAPFLLAHAMAHEIAHMLQVSDAHSSTGLMKAKWTRQDYLQMAVKPLPFTASDITLIHLGMERRAALVSPVSAQLLPAR